MRTLTHIPAGAAIPQSVHAVSVSIPDIASVIGFESKEEQTLRRIPRGYPRFRVHEYVARLAALIKSDRGDRDEELVLTRSRRASRAAAAYAGLPAAAAFEGRAVHGVAVPPGGDRERRVRSFVQHAGCHLSSREAEDVLVDAGQIAERQPELRCGEDPERRIKEALVAAYGALDARNVSLHNSGMNAVYAAIAALTEVQHEQRRRRWLQLGWIFFDTVKLLQKRIVDVDHESLATPFDMGELERIVAARGDVAGIVAEVPSNPLIQTPDVLALRRIADEAGCAVVLDATIATPHNVDVLRYADVVCESMTKYASGSADVLMGAAVVNPASPLADRLREGLPRYGDAPYTGDAARLAYRIEGYEDRVRKVNQNSVGLAELLTGHPAVRRLHWTYEPRSADNYRRVERFPGAAAGLLMLDLRVPLERVYDHLAVAKGPSFGADFTMASPQVFVAHFDLLSDPAGREVLRQHGLHRDMLRVSVGTEDLDQIASVFHEAFAAAC